MSNEIFNTFSAKETQKLAGVILAGLIEKSPKDGALVLALQGNLGSGKTTFTQGIARALGVRGRVASPTFVLMHKFQIPRNKKQTNLKFKIQNLYHFDCYRINRPEEILDLGWQEIISNSKNIVVIEWPEKIKKFLPKNTIYLKFKFINPVRGEASNGVNENQREIKG